MAENNRNWNQQNWDQSRNRYREDDDFRQDYNHGGYGNMNYERNRGNYGNAGYSNDSAHGREMENQGGHTGGYGSDRDYNTGYGKQRGYNQGYEQMSGGWQSSGQYNSPYQSGSDWHGPSRGGSYRDEWQRQDWGRGNVNAGYGGYTGRDQGRSYGDSLENDFRRDREMNRYRDVYGSESNYGYRGRSNNDRGWWDRTKDEVSSWFGDDEAERRRRMDEMRSGGNHRGRGPKDYNRSQDRIREDVCDRLTDDDHLDASDIKVEVKGTEVILSGTVENREQKRRAEDLVESISGVRNVENRIKINYRDEDGWASGRETTNERIRNTNTKG